MTIIDEKYLSKINEFPSGSAFRGQADSNWKLYSGATRRLIKHHEKIMEDRNFSQIYANYHRDVLVRPARTNGFDIDDGYRISDLQLLAKLQHFEAATGLLDFTWNPLVALWFACKDNGNCDGKVFVINLRDPLRFEQVPSETEKQSVEAIFLPGGNPDKLLYWEAKIHGEAAARILRQRSVFVIGRPLISEDVVQHIEIKASDKAAIRKELEDICDIGERTLFMDIHGFSIVNKAESPVHQIEDPNYYLFLGNQFYQQSDYPQAVEVYDKCINLEPQVSELYFFRGNAKAEMRNYEKAIRDYNLAIHFKNRPVLNMPTNVRVVLNPILSMIFFNRGNIKAELNDYEGALDDYSEVLQLGPEHRDTFFNRANIQALLHKFEDAIDDYNEAIRFGFPAHFNIGNTLVILGRFEEALRFYNTAMERPVENIGFISNRNNTVKILDMIDGREYESHFVYSENRINVHVQVARDDLSETTFLFIGNKGNTGNFGYGLQGGQGFDGQNPFLVKVSSQ